MNPLGAEHLRVSIIDANLRPVRPLADFKELAVTARDNARGAGLLTVSTDHPALSALQAEGSGVIVTWMGKTLISGEVAERDAAILPGGDVPFEITDDWSLFDTPAWVRPGAPLAPSSLDDLAQAWHAPGLLKTGTVQSQVGYYAWPSGTMRAESAAKRLIVENLVDRMGLPLMVEPDRGRGREVVMPEVRFGSIAEALDSLLFDAGGSLRVYQIPGEEFARVDWRDPLTFPSPIYAESGLLVEPTYTRKLGASRAVVGGNGSGAGRMFFERRDSELEAKSRWPREVFASSNDAELVWPEDLDSEYQVPKYFRLQPGVAQADKDAVTSSLVRAAEDALAENAPTLSISAKLTTNERFYFGPGGFELGDRLTVMIAGTPVQERIAEVEFVVDDTGIDITPVLGENKAQERRMARELQALRRGQRKSNRL